MADLAVIGRSARDADAAHADRQRRPPEFPPPWAVAWGDDHFGLWAELAVKTVIQRLRWIEPGRFFMGSDDAERALLRDEAWERWAQNESPRHCVQLTQGFWLADTACTQAMWFAVVGGENPSHFSDDPQLPVEQVSFDDVQGFLRRLQGAFSEGRGVDLPTEAEWEYACRAGTNTAFAIGATVTPQQVNYDGHYPYGDAAKGLNRERTVPVKALPANRWGLYQMHGNVWEWCSDVLRNYADTAVAEGVVLDPAGQRGSGPAALRALRGGSWFRLAGTARSAYRGLSQRDARFHYLGFRFALRSTSPVLAEPGPQGQVLLSGPEGES